MAEAVPDLMDDDQFAKQASKIVMYDLQHRHVEGVEDFM